MSLKIVQYKHYGCTMIGGEQDDSDFEDKFYMSFFELTNGKTISLYHNVNYKYNKVIHSDISCYYTQCYIFGEDFFNWWNKTMGDQDKGLGHPTKEEEELTINFYKKNIDSNREIKTDTILLK